MATRIGKYKVSKRESAISLIDGGTVAGNATVTGDVQLSSATTFGESSSLKTISKTATSATIAVTKDTDYAVPAISQPAGTIIKDVILIPAGNIVTAGNNGDDLDMEIGTAASGGQLVALTALLDDGGSAITWAANYPMYIIENGRGNAAQSFTGLGIATTEAVAWAATSYSAAARDIHVNFRANTNNLATAATTIKVIITFQYV